MKTINQTISTDEAARELVLAAMAMAEGLADVLWGLDCLTGSDLARRAKLLRSALSHLYREMPYIEVSSHPAAAAYALRGVGKLAHASCNAAATAAALSGVDVTELDALLWQAYKQALHLEQCSIHNPH